MLGSVRAAVVSGGALAHIGAPVAGSFTLSADMEVTGCTIYTTPFDGGIPVGTRIGVAPDLTGLTTIPWLASGLSTSNPGSGGYPVTVEFDNPVTLLAGVVYCITGDCDIVVANGSTINGLVATNRDWLSGHPFAVSSGSYRVPFQLYGFAPPGTSVSDVFTRADSTSVLGTADTGQAWSVLAGTWGISSNQAYISNGSTQSYAVIDSTLADCIISVKMNGGLTSGGGITFRALDVTHLWFTEVSGSTSYLYQCNGAGPVLIADMLTTWVAGDVMTVILRGNSIVVQRNGVQVFTYTDSTFATYTKHGLRDYGGSVRLDDFSVKENTTAHVTGSAPVSVGSSSVSEYRGVRVSGLAPVDVFTSSRSPIDFEVYLDEDAVLIPFELSGLMDPIFPPPIPPVNFDGLPDPITSPTLSKSTTTDGHLVAGTYRYSYAAWKGSKAQATAPSPTSEITLSGENTVTLTYPTIDGADGYLVYREDL